MRTAPDTLTHVAATAFTLRASAAAFVPRATTPDADPDADSDTDPDFAEVLAACEAEQARAMALLDAELERELLAVEALISGELDAASALEDALPPYRIREGGHWQCRGSLHVRELSTRVRGASAPVLARPGPWFVACLTDSLTDRSAALVTWAVGTEAPHAAATVCWDVETATPYGATATAVAICDPSPARPTAAAMTEFDIWIRTRRFGALGRADIGGPSGAAALRPPGDASGDTVRTRTARIDGVRMATAVAICFA